MISEVKCEDMSAYVQRRGCQQGCGFDVLSVYTVTEYTVTEVWLVVVSAVYLWRGGAGRPVTLAVTGAALAVRVRLGAAL